MLINAMEMYTWILNVFCSHWWATLMKTVGKCWIQGPWAIWFQLSNSGFGPRGPKTKKGASGPYGTWKVRTIWPMDLVFMSTFDNQSISIGCVGKLGHLFGFLRHYLLREHKYAAYLLLQSVQTMYFSSCLHMEWRATAWFPSIL